MTSMKVYILSITATIASATLFGFAPIIVRILEGYGLTIVTIIFFRNISSCLAAFALLKIRSSNISITRDQFLKFIFVTLFGICLASITLYSSYNYIGAGIASVLHFLYPAFTTLLVWMFYREKAGMGRIIGLVLTMIGMAFILEIEGNFSLFGAFLAVFSGLAYAIYLLGMEKTKLSNLPPLLITFYVSLISVVIVAAYGGVTKGITFVISFNELILLAILGISSSLIGITLLQIGIKYLRASTTALLSMFEPIAGIIFSMLLLGEQISTFQWIGSVLIISALVPCFWKEIREYSSKKSTGTKRL